MAGSFQSSELDIAIAANLVFVLEEQSEPEKGQADTAKDQYDNDDPSTSRCLRPCGRQARRPAEGANKAGRRLLIRALHG